MEDFVQKLIPTNQTCFVDVNVADIDNDDSSYSATLRISIRSKDEFRLWLKEHERLSSCTYRVLKTTPTDGRYVAYKVGFTPRSLS